MIMGWEVLVSVYSLQLLCSLNLNHHDTTDDVNETGRKLYHFHLRNVYIFIMRVIPVQLYLYSLY